MQVLIVVDMQRDFIEGALGTKEAQAILPRVKQRIQSFSGKVLFTQDTHTPQYLRTQEGQALPVPHCIQGTPGWMLHPVLEALCQQPPIQKPTFGSVTLGETLLALHQQQPIERITLIGLCTDICVISNALLLKAFLPEVPIAVDASCCAGVTPQSHQQALSAMEACQIIVENR